MYGGSTADTMAQGRVTLTCECTCVVSSVTWVPTRWLAPYARGSSLQGSTPYLPRPLPRNSLQLLNNHKTLFPLKNNETQREQLFFSKQKQGLVGLCFTLTFIVRMWNVHESSAAAANEQQETHREGEARRGRERGRSLYRWFLCGGRRGREKKKGDEGAAGLRTAM